MNKFALGLISGIVISTIIFVPLLLGEHRSIFQSGVNTGNVAGRFEAADALQKEFGIYDGQTPYKRLLSVKTTDIISIETNGVKTVKIIP